MGESAVTFDPASGLCCITVPLVNCGEMTDAILGIFNPEEMASLRSRHPAFSFGYESLGHHGRCWIAKRQVGQTPGVHTVITTSLTELYATLDPQPYAQNPRSKPRYPGGGVAECVNRGIAQAPLAYAVPASGPVNES